MSEAVAENKMGTMPENKLLISMAVPLMISNFVQALYNVVDSIFVSRITTDEVVQDALGNPVPAGTDAISALGLAFPIQMVIIALCMGTAVGVSSLLSRSLGEGDRETANSTAMHGIFLMLCSYVVSLSIGLFGAKWLISMQGAVGRQLEYGTAYLRIICCCSIGIYMEVMMERLLQSTGRTALSIIPQITGAVINVIMDPILIFGLFGMPKLGVSGAALATVFGQTVATFIGLFLNLKKNPDITLSLRKFRLNGHIIKGIYTVGAPAICLQAVGSFMNFGMNSILLGLHTSAVAVFTIYYKLQSFFFMPMFGLNNALVPIIGYNYGAGNKHRMLKSYRLALIYGFSLIFVGFLLFEIMPDKLIMIFNTGDEALLTLGVPALRKIGVHYLFAWYCILTGGLFQALGNGMYGFITSISRQMVVLLPAAWILGRIGGVDLVWWSFPIAEVMSLMATVFFYILIDRKVIRKMPEA